MLKLSSDRKVSPYSKLEFTKREPNGRHKPLIRNTFGIPSGPEASCIGATEFCESCYAMKFEKMYPNVNSLIWHNFNELQACGSNVAKLTGLLEGLILQFEVEVMPFACSPVFRIHWDGDFYSKAYTIAWANVIRANPHIQFWAYTRSFQFVSVLKDLDNLTVYLSVDRFNVKKAKAAKKAHPWVKLAFCGETWTETEELASQFPEERRGPKCPELTGKRPMVNDKGVGACVACMLCINGVNNVRFAVKGRKS